MSSRAPSNAQDPGPVIVCCAAAEAVEIREALLELEALGHTIEIVDGVEEDPRRLTPVIEQFHGDGLYVLCRSPQLGRGTVEQLREILLAQHVPFGRTLTVATQRSRDLVDRVRASLARSSTRRTRTDAERPAVPPAKQRATVSRHAIADEETVTGVQPAIKPAPPVRPRRATIQNLAPPPRPSERASAREDDFDPPTEPLPDLATRRSPAEAAAARVAALPPPPPDSAAISMTDAVVDLHDHDPETSIMNASLEQLDFSDLDAAAAVAARRPAPAAPLPPDVTHSPVGPIRTGNTNVAPAPRRPEPAPMPSIPDAPRPAAASPPTFPAAPSSPPPAPPRSFTPTPPPPSAATGGAFPSASISSPAGAAASTAAEPDAAPSRALWWAGGLAAVAVVAIALAFAFGGDDDAKAPAADASAATSPDEDGKTLADNDATKGAPDGTKADAAKAKGGADHEGDAAPTLEPSPGATISALADRKVRALDVLLVQPQSSGPMAHPEAAQYCEALDIAELDGWRLPHVGELSSLTDAGMVGRSTYWSATAGDTFGDTHLAWNARRRRAEQTSSPSRVLCVRDDRRG
jgi:hypothetical protein